MQSAVETNRLRIILRKTLWCYWVRRQWGRVRGAVRVFSGKNASVPKGWHDTTIGRIRVDDYYGGLILSLGNCDLYWTAHGYDGWGAGPGQTKFLEGGVEEDKNGL